jgi:hypothetical protein
MFDHGISQKQFILTKKSKKKDFLSTSTSPSLVVSVITFFLSL